jgi:predicted DNA-binding transcriptional regulator AlpA
MSLLLPTRCLPGKLTSFRPICSWHPPCRPIGLDETYCPFSVINFRSHFTKCSLDFFRHEHRSNPWCVATSTSKEGDTAMRFLSMQEVCVMFGVSRSTIDRWEVDCGFPGRVRLGVAEPVSYRTKLGRTVTKRSNCRIGFPDVEVNAWAQQRMDARPSQGDRAS